MRALEKMRTKAQINILYVFLRVLYMFFRVFLGPVCILYVFLLCFWPISGTPRDAPGRPGTFRDAPARSGNYILYIYIYFLYISLVITVLFCLFLSFTVAGAGYVYDFNSGVAEQQARADAPNNVGCH